MTRLMQPTAALIAYTCEDDYQRNEYFLESRSIGSNGVMGAGKPVSNSFIKKLLENFSLEASSSIPHGVLPKSMLYAGMQNEKYAWYSPPCRKYLYFKNGLDIPNGEYALPGLVWVVRKNTLSLYAYKSKRLTPKTPLHAAPFFNVSPEDGHVCLGNAKLELPEKLSFNAFIKYWEDKFFFSEFSHILGGNPTRNNLVLVMKKGKEIFDNDELVPIKKLKLKDIIK